MRDSSEAAWWRLTWRLAAAVTGGGAVLAIVATSLEADAAGPQFFGLPLAEFFGLIVVPLILMAAAFVFAGRQRALDRRFDVAED
ncbi:MAG: DUF4212 domain-containing protein [Bauldia sp.]